jgi:hypothetical protein
VLDFCNVKQQVPSMSVHDWMIGKAIVFTINRPQLQPRPHIARCSLYHFNNHARCRRASLRFTKGQREIYDG